MSTTLRELARQAEQLPISEQIKLAMWLTQNARAAIDTDTARYSWTDFAGIASYPFAGEDA